MFQRATVLATVVMYRNNVYTTFYLAACGGWSAWSEWSECSVSCGLNGITSRLRVCDNPAPANGGEACEGESSQNKDCSAAPCREISFNHLSFVVAVTYALYRLHYIFSNLWRMEWMVGMVELQRQLRSRRSRYQEAVLR